MIAGQGAKIYEDDKVAAFLADKPATIGHIIVMPKEHKPIFEALDDDLVEHISAVANKISIAVFEAIRCEGTNMIIHNGVEAGQDEPHFCMHIIARKSGDGLVFEWQPKQMDESAFDSVVTQLKQELEKEPDTVSTKIPTVPDKKEDAGEGDGADDKKEAPLTEENYLIKQLRRQP